MMSEIIAIERASGYVRGATPLSQYPILIFNWKQE